MSRRTALTQREIEVQALALRGLTSREIALQLGVSLGTVRSHKRSIALKQRSSWQASRWSTRWSA